MTAHIDLTILRLRSGAGTTGATDDLCAYQAVRAWVHAEATNDDLIKGASEVIRSYVIALNDAITDDERRSRLLVPLIPRIAIAKDGYEPKRRAVLRDAARRIFTPQALDSAAITLDRAGLTDHATTLREHAKTLAEPIWIEAVAALDRALAIGEV